MASAHAFLTEKQTWPGRGFFFPSHQRWKFQETSAKQGSLTKWQFWLAHDLFPTYFNCSQFFDCSDFKINWTQVQLKCEWFTILLLFVVVFFVCFIFDFKVTTVGKTLVHSITLVFIILYLYYYGLRKSDGEFVWFYVML